MAKKLKLSPWHDGSVKPVHVGVYERAGCETGFSYWDGEYWGWYASSPTICLRPDQNAVSKYQTETWRGVLK